MIALKLEVVCVIFLKGAKDRLLVATKESELGGYPQDRFHAQPNDTDIE